MLLVFVLLCAAVVCAASDKIELKPPPARQFTGTKEKKLHHERQRRLLAEIERNRKGRGDKRLASSGVANKADVHASAKKMKRFIMERFPEFNPTKKATTEETPAEVAQRKMAVRDAMLAKIAKTGGVANSIPQMEFVRERIVEPALNSRPDTRPPLSAAAAEAPDPEKPELWFEISEEEKQRAEENRKRNADLRRMAEQQQRLLELDTERQEQQRQERQQQKTEAPPPPAKKPVSFKRRPKNHVPVANVANTAFQRQAPSRTKGLQQLLSSSDPLILGGTAVAAICALLFCLYLLFNETFLTLVCLIGSVVVTTFAVQQFVARRGGQGDMPAFFSAVTAQRVVPVLGVGTLLLLIRARNTARRALLLLAGVALGVHWTLAQNDATASGEQAVAAAVGVLLMHVIAAIRGFGAAPAVTVKTESLPDAQQLKAMMARLAELESNQAQQQQQPVKASPSSLKQRKKSSPIASPIKAENETEHQRQTQAQDSKKHQ